MKIQSEATKTNKQQIQQSESPSNAIIPLCGGNQIEDQTREEKKYGKTQLKTQQYPTPEVQRDQEKQYVP